MYPPLLVLVLPSCHSYIHKPLVTAAPAEPHNPLTPRREYNRRVREVVEVSWVEEDS